MPEKTPFWLDVLSAFWVFVVGLTYFGGYFAPHLGPLGPFLATLAQYGFLVYTVMVIVSVLVLAFRYLHRPCADESCADESCKDARTKKRK